MTCCDACADKRAKKKRKVSKTTNTSCVCVVANEKQIFRFIPKTQTTTNQTMFLLPTPNPEPDPPIMEGSGGGGQTADLITWCIGSGGCVPKTYTDLQQEGQSSLDFINNVRTSEYGRSTLQWSDTLAHAALMHAIDHLRRGYNIRHQAPSPSPWGIDPVNRINNSGWYGGTTGENIGVWSPDDDNDPPIDGTTLADAGDVLLLRNALWRVQDADVVNYPNGEGHHRNNINPAYTHIGMAKIDFPPCMKVGPGYLDFNNNPGYLENPYNHYDHQDIVDGSTMTQWIWGRSIMVYCLAAYVQDPEPLLPIPDTCTMDIYTNPETPYDVGQPGYPNLVA